MASHKLPPAPQHYNARYSETTYNGLQLRDAHEENPESILDEHVQRVMRTPGCQSPGTGRHSPKSRSPDGILAGKVPGLAVPLAPGHGKHLAKQGLKPDTAGMYHHKHVYHIHHTGGVKPKEQIESEAMQRVQNNFAWNVEPHHYATKSRSYADSMGMPPNPMESLGHKYASFIDTFTALIFTFSLSLFYV